MAVDEVVHVEKLSMERWEFNLRVFDFKRFDELEMEIAQVA